MFLEGPLGTTLRLPTKTSKHKSIGGKCDLKSFQLIQFPGRELGFQGSHWRVGAGPRHLFPKKQQGRGSLLPIVLVKMISVASGCASTLGGMVKRVICLLHSSAPKYMALGTNLAPAFSHSLWGVPSSL